MLKWLSHLYQKIKKHYSHPTLSEWIEKHKKEQLETVVTCSKVIKLHEFQKHMARKTIEAMEVWEKENDSK